MYTIRPETVKQLKTLHKVKETNAFDFWDIPKLQRASRVMIEDVDEKVFVKFLKRYDIYYERAGKNVQQLNFVNRSSEPPSNYSSSLLL